MAAIYYHVIWSFFRTELGMIIWFHGEIILFEYISDFRFPYGSNGIDKDTLFKMQYCECVNPDPGSPLKPLLAVVR